MSQINTDNSINTALQRKPTNGFADMSSVDFIRIMFTELANQDPFQPNDSAALLNQLNSIRSIESDLKLTRQLEALVLGNQFASAGNMLGKLVGGLTENNDRVLGYVIAVKKEGDEIILELDTGDIMKFNNVETVVDPTIFEDAQDDAAETETGT